MSTGDPGDRREGDVSVAGGQESVEQHLTLVHNKSRRGSFTSHAFPELHHKVSSAEIDLTSGASFVNSGLKLDLFT